MTEITAARIAELRAMWEKATPGPWESCHAGTWTQLVGPDGNETPIERSTPAHIRRTYRDDQGRRCHEYLTHAIRTDAIADVIAASRTVVPELLDELERVRGMLDTAMEYARHSEGCSAAVGNYPCRCRWNEEGLQIRAYLAAVEGEPQSA